MRACLRASKKKTAGNASGLKKKTARNAGGSSTVHSNNGTQESYLVASAAIFEIRFERRLILRDAVSFLITPLLTEAMIFAVKSRRACSTSFDFAAIAEVSVFSTVLTPLRACELRAERLIV